MFDFSFFEDGTVLITLFFKGVEQCLFFGNEKLNYHSMFPLLEGCG